MASYNPDSFFTSMLTLSCASSPNQFYILVPKCRDVCLMKWVVCKHACRFAKHLPFNATLLDETAEFFKLAWTWILNLSDVPILCYASMLPHFLLHKVLS